MALPLSSTISGWATIAKTRMNGVTTRAVAQRRGQAEELRHQLADDHRERRGQDQRDGHRDGVDRAVGQAEPARAGRCSREATLGSTRKPTSSVVRVMPTWEAESWVDSCRSAASTCRLRGSPRGDRRSTVARSSVM